MELNGWNINDNTKGCWDKDDKRMVERITTDKIILDRLCDAQQNTYYGKIICGTPLHCSYGAIGYTFQYNGKDWDVDYELQKITIND